jgi:ABC-2 type transport system ATP-binding protein
MSPTTSTDTVMIRLEHLSKAYDVHIVLRDLSLHFEKGKVYGIVGENGSGKTTLFKCMTGLEAHHGQVTSAFERLKDHIGYLPTDLFFFSKMTGREYLQLLCNARQIAEKDIDQKNIFDLPLDQYAATYSTGMKKKLALTAILLQPNDIFILDEPYNGVDIHSNMIITEIIHRLKALGKTVMISSHIFSTLKETCDHIHVIENGQISRSVGRDEFDALEKEMKNFTVQDKVNRLHLR